VSSSCIELCADVLSASGRTLHPTAVWARTPIRATCGVRAELLSRLEARGDDIAQPVLAEVRNAIRRASQPHSRPGNWLEPVLGRLLTSASDQQVRLVRHVLQQAGLQALPVDMDEALPMDDPAATPLLVEYAPKWER